MCVCVVYGWLWHHYFFIFIYFFGLLLVSQLPSAHTHHPLFLLWPCYNNSIFQSHNYLMTENNFGFAFVRVSSCRFSVSISILVAVCSVYLLSQVNSDREQWAKTDWENNRRIPDKSSNISLISFPWKPKRNKIVRIGL